jgi:hypothetical protein
MAKKNQPVIMKVTFYLQRTFNRERGMQFKVVGHCQPDYEQTAKSRFIHQMQRPEGQTFDLN